MELPSSQTLRVYAFTCATPMVGFGFMDNTIMIFIGDILDNTIGVSMGLATMTAAAMGQAASDCCGTLFGGVVESCCAALGLPEVRFASEQRDLGIVHRVRVLSSAVGVALGCCLGMVWLLFLDLGKSQRMKQMEELQTLFMTLAKEAHDIFNVSQCSLYIFVDFSGEAQKQNMHLFTMAKVGKTPSLMELEASYNRMVILSEIPRASSSSSTGSQGGWRRTASFGSQPTVPRAVVAKQLLEIGWTEDQVRRILESAPENFTKAQYIEFMKERQHPRHKITPLRHGTRHHVFHTGEFLNIPNVYLDERFRSHRKEEAFWGSKAISLLVAPVKDSQGRVIGVVEMKNRLNSDNGIIPFTMEDERLARMLCEHASTFIEQCLGDDEEDMSIWLGKYLGAQDGIFARLQKQDNL